MPGTNIYFYPKRKGNRFNPFVSRSVIMYWCFEHHSILRSMKQICPCGSIFIKIYIHTALPENSTRKRYFPMSWNEITNMEFSPHSTVYRRATYEHVIQIHTLVFELVSLYLVPISKLRYALFSWKVLGNRNFFIKKK